MIIERTSSFTGKVNTMDLNVTSEQVTAWESGTLIQNAMPNLSVDEREFLLTGTTPKEWDKMFGRME